MKSLILSISFSLFISSVFAQVTFSTDPIRVNEERIEQRIQEFAKFGINEKGQPYRVAYSQGDIDGRAYFMDLMKKAGLEVHIDYAGNIIGKRAGKDPQKNPLPLVPISTWYPMEAIMMGRLVLSPRLKS
jgi:beta-ureidopropionase / N-carbamoyl-L-amino-acid hydrolase